ncbi:hypothetical protein BP00DRAFT_254398 [Aspergillus indologenus CBS 114.80]|uniref:Uncharacterized protein n=1 Tax=Aspergillus indologenus CBS 114.80 TaxID=1450541 RepID=A0A2V5J4F1_9EURO|nr:hypothetical protein BP00DRAFT_254398 [Aspergillus indologenus CBS 114.80]
MHGEYSGWEFLPSGLVVLTRRALARRGRFVLTHLQIKDWFSRLFIGWIDWIVYAVGVTVYGGYYLTEPASQLKANLSFCRCRGCKTTGSRRSKTVYYHLTDNRRRTTISQRRNHKKNHNHYNINKSHLINMVKTNQTSDRKRLTQHAGCTCTCKLQAPIQAIWTPPVKVPSRRNTLHNLMREKKQLTSNYPVS